jgi:farnesyl diphosphate synthase
MDSSITRRGNPCWYKVPGVGLDAVNDALILESFLFFLIDRHFDGKQYVALQKLFHDVSLKTQMGQMLDTMSEKVCFACLIPVLSIFLFPKSTIR